MVQRILGSYQQAIELLTELIDQDPSSGRFRLALARCFRNRMAFSRMVGHGSMEHSSLEDSIRHLDSLVTDFPNIPMYQFELADTLCLKTARPRSERDADYENRVHRSVSICENLISAYPTHAEYRALMANSLSRLAAIHRAGGDIEQARTSWLQALELYRSLTSQYEDVSSYQVLFIHTLTSLADLEDTDGTVSAAVRFRKMAIEHLHQRLAVSDNPFYRRWLERLQVRMLPVRDVQN